MTGGAEGRTRRRRDRLGGAGHAALRRPRLCGVIVVALVAAASVSGCSGGGSVADSAFCNDARAAAALEPANLQLDASDPGGLQQAGRDAAGVAPPGCPLPVLVQYARVEEYRHAVDTTPDRSRSVGLAQHWTNDGAVGDVRRTWERWITGRAFDTVAPGELRDLNYLAHAACLADTEDVAVPLLRRGVPVAGIELSERMVAQLRRKVGAEALPVVVGDMATARVEGPFSLVYLVFNTIGNLRTQDEQVACFRNAARHLAPGGRFVIELWIPGIRRLPPGQDAVPFHVGRHHVGFDTYDLVTQQGTSHHYRRHDDGTVTYGASNFRYVWPAECDLMARLAGMQLESRYADWRRSGFTAASESHVSVWRKPA